MLRKPKPTIFYLAKSPFLARQNKMRSTLIRDTNLNKHFPYFCLPIIHLLINSAYIKNFKMHQMFCFEVHVA